MTQLILLTSFVLIMAILQEFHSHRIALYNSITNSHGTAIKKDYGVFMIMAMIAMAFMVACRGSEVGNDTAEYIRIFQQINFNADYVGKTRFEYGYIFLNKLAGSFSSNPQSVFIISALIQYTIFIWFINKHSANYALSLLLFFFLIFASTMNIVRQSLAMAFVFVAFDRVFEQKTFGAIFWIIVASLFHASAIITLIIVIIPYISFNKYLVLALLTVCISCAFTNLLYKLCQIVAPGYAHYFSGVYAQSGYLAITYKLLSGLAYFIVIFIPQIRRVDSIEYTFSKKEDKIILRRKNLVLWISAIGCIGYLLGYKINLIDRVLLYFSMFVLLFVPNALQKYGKTSRIIISCATIALLLSYSIVVQKLRPGWNTIYPYSFFWQ